MARIGILGTGRMAVRLGRILLDNGHHVVLGSRSGARAAQLSKILNRDRCIGATYAEAADQPYVLPAILVRDGLFDVIDRLRARLPGKILIDIANPFNSDYTDFTLPWDTSASEQMQLRLPQSRVVGIFKNVAWEAFENPVFPEGISDIYVVGDDGPAKAEVCALFTPSSFRLVDAGRLANARTIERMTLLAMEVGRRLGYFPRIGWKLLGEPWKAGAKDAWAKVLAAAV